jgi:UDP-N-acetylmuramoylalanine--D-glutamate ligase
MQERVVVVGLGRSGTGAARLLNALGADVCVLESGVSPELAERAANLQAEGISVQLGKPLSLSSFVPPPQKVVLSPGIPFNHPVMDQLRDQGIAVVGEMEVAWDGFSDVPWIGVTGTNGKTTVTSLVGHLLQHAGLDAPVCGNIGSSAAELALSRRGSNRPAWAVVELSSFQIEAAPSVAPSIGIWTTLTPDHLDRHGSVNNYRSIKASLLHRSSIQILNANDPDLCAHANEWPRALWVTAGAKEQLPTAINPQIWICGGYLQNKNGPLFPASALAMPGRHNLQNLVIATAAALEVGLNAKQIELGCRSFPGVPHRLELIHNYDGISYYNDSKATNYDASLVALLALDSPLVLLAGGRAKRGEPSQWLKALEQKAKAVVLFGEATPTFNELLGASGYTGRIERRASLDQALPLAAQLAKELGANNVLLSPACASFDQYGNYEERGEHFRELVKALGE